MASIVSRRWWLLKAAVMVEGRGKSSGAVTRGHSLNQPAHSTDSLNDSLFQVPSLIQ